MKRLIECVPNFSEGRDMEVIFVSKSIIYSLSKILRIHSQQSPRNITFKDTFFL